MCNPRRIRVTATRQLDAAWEREVSRMVEVSGEAIGEARLRQPLSATVGASALRALEIYLANPESGWTEVEAGYRHDVEGGYVVYHIDDQALEIVAVRTEAISMTGQVTRQVSGRVTEEMTTEGEGGYYDDGYMGQTREVGEQEARAAAERSLDSQARDRINEVATAAETQAAAEAEAQAEAQAVSKLERLAQEREADLAQQAEQELRTVGVRCRQLFNEALAIAYRDAILAYARRQGADNILCNENGEFLDIEFTMRQ